MLRADTINPGTLFGGTWALCPDDLYLMSSTNDTPMSQIAGSNVTGSTAISIAQMPGHGHTGYTTSGGAHRHNIAYYSSGAGQGSNNDYITNSGMGWSTNYRLNEWITFADGKSEHSHNIQTNNTGSGQGHTHSISALQLPALNLRVWRRTA